MLRTIVSIILLCCFFITTVFSPVQAQGVSSWFNLPVLGGRIAPSPAFEPTLIKGMTLYPDNPLKFDFIIDQGDQSADELSSEIQKLVYYFLTALTVSQEDLWVNLSPYEEDRIIPDSLDSTKMGETLLAQDYLLKQMTASLMHPDSEVGKRFWQRVYQRAFDEFGTTEIPVDTFNKIWIVPKQAQIRVHERTVYVAKVTLDVMLDHDYQARQMITTVSDDFSSSLTREVMREIILPEIRQEINEGAHFAPLRQLVYALVLAKWYKQNLEHSLLNDVYSDRNLTDFYPSISASHRDKIYQQYMQAYEKGVANLVHDEHDALTQEVIPRHYFSGGFTDQSIVAENMSVADRLLQDDLYTAQVQLQSLTNFYTPSESEQKWREFFESLGVNLDPTTPEVYLLIAVIVVFAIIPGSIVISEMARKLTQKIKTSNQSSQEKKSTRKKRVTFSKTENFSKKRKRDNQFAKKSPKKDIFMQEGLIDTKTPSTKKSAPKQDVFQPKQFSDKSEPSLSRKELKEKYYSSNVTKSFLSRKDTKDTSMQAKTGGIDLKAFPLVDEQGVPFVFEYDEAMVTQLNERGHYHFFPVISSISPMENLSTLLGL